MVWTLRDDPGALPDVIAGPILRRVEPGSVSIWIAVRGVCDEIILEIYDGATMVQRGVRQPLRFGSPGISIAVVPATGQQLQASVGGDPLKPKVYSYRVGLRRAPAALQWMDMSVVAPTGAKPRVPTFILPPDHFTNLRLLHGSCRKPHGEGFDALALADQLVAKNAAQRPHALLLTGDQIYADDVADALLGMILVAEKKLIGVDGEPLSATIDGKTRTSELLPGTRALPVSRAGMTASLGTLPRFDAGLSKSHLIGFNEYLLMHLFVWSDVLWPTTIRDLPADFPGRQLAAEIDFLETFQRSLPAVRRVLANAPAYMIFDDHDVTDDWNLNADWSYRVYSGKGRSLFELVPPDSEPDPVIYGAVPSVGRQIIANGLGAYALCQAWGNTPAAFESGSASTLLVELTKMPISRTAVEHLLLPPTNRFDNVEANSVRGMHSPPFQWDFTVALGASATATFLDGRTRRSFLGTAPGSATRDPHLPAEVIDAADVPRQIRAAGKPLHILVAPGPLFELPFVERALKFGGESYQEIGTLSPYADDFSLKAFKWVTSGARAVSSWFPFGLDTEGWGANELAFDWLLGCIAEASAPYVMVLSGDVHYSYAFHVYFAARRLPREAGVPFSALPSRNRSFEMVNFVSSSLRNETTGIASTVKLSRAGTGQARLASASMLQDYISLGHAAAGSPMGALDAAGSRPKRVYPASAATVSNVSRLFTSTEAPSWAYRVSTIWDRRDDSSTGGTLADAAAGLKRHPTRFIIGKNNIGEVSFSTADGTLEMVQILYWEKPSSSRGWLQPSGRDASTESRSVSMTRLAKALNQTPPFDFFPSR